MTGAPTYHDGWLAGFEAGGKAAEMLAGQLEAAIARADAAERRATDARADAAEQQYIATAARQSLIAAVARRDAT